tara:strand:+ start:44 stop:250 length:207 start_codon:yes stop_codon:yes gene_type:complete
MKREEIAKVRKELQAVERALDYSENKTVVNKNLSPVALPDKARPAPPSNVLDGVIQLPPKQKRTENKW